MMDMEETAELPAGSPAVYEKPEKPLAVLQSSTTFS